MALELFKISLLLLSVLGFVWPLKQSVGNEGKKQETFSNPIHDGNFPNSNIFRLGEFYYLVTSEKPFNEIIILRSAMLSDFRHADQSIVYRVPDGYSDLRGGKIHQVYGELYMYFEMQNGTESHRMYVIKAEAAWHPMGRWGPASRLLDGVMDIQSMHGTILEHNYGLYFVWASKDQETKHNKIYIASMDGPTLVTSQPVLLREPTQPWECVEACITDAPSIMYGRNKAFIVFTASPTYVAETALSHISIDKGLDPLTSSNWISAPGPVFTSNEEESVYSTGHSTFTTSPDETEIWMVYHASEVETNVSDHKTCRIEKITWNEDDNTPVFPKPHGYNHPQPLPSS